MSRRKQLLLPPKAFRLNTSEENMNEPQIDPIAEPEANNPGERSESSSRSSLQNGIEVVVEDDKRYACSFCACSFSNLTHLRDHEQEHADQMPYRCNLCAKGFKHKKSRDRHRHQHSGEKTHKCPKCQASFFRSDHLKIHIRTHDGGRVSVESSPSQLGTPCGRVGTPVTCSICSTHFSNSKLLLKHMDQEHSFHHEMIESEKIAWSNASLDMNDSVSEVAESTDTSSYSCGLCSAIFGQVSLLQTHTLNCHSVRELKNVNSNSLNYDNVRDPRYPCERCQRSFDSILALHQHTANVHASEEHRVTPTHGQALPVETDRSGGSYECSQCNISFDDLSQFGTHMKTEHSNHTNVMDTTNNYETFENQTHRCDICVAELPSVDELNLHVANHYAHRQVSYSCKGCHMFFSRGDELQMHLLQVHSAHVFRCSLCAHMVESKVQMQVHMIAEHCREMSEWRCRSCNASFSTQDRFQLHVQVVHMGASPAHIPTPPSSLALPQPHPVLSCSLCQKVFANQRQFSHHCASEHPAFACQYCSKEFAVEYLYDKHMETVHADEGSTCKVQSPPASRSSINLLHQSIANKPIDGLLFSALLTHPNLIKCNVCDQKYDTLALLADHKLKHCKVMHCTSCSVCQESLSSLQEFFMHTKRHNLNTQLAVSCIICKQSLIAPVEVETHGKYHLNLLIHSEDTFESWNSSSLVFKESDSQSTRDKEVQPIQVKLEMDTSPLFENTTESKMEQLPFQCLKCQKKFSSESEIQAHIASHVMREGVSHACLLCQQVFDSPSRLQCHLIDHSFVGCTQLQCYLCGLVFSLSSPLQQHMQIQHSLDSRPYQCNQCDLRFFFSAEMDHHLLEHKHSLPQISKAGIVRGQSTEREGSHPCPHCPKVFNSLSALQGHSHVHMISRTHRCPQCNKMFSSASKLRNHIRLHSGDKPFHCYICFRQFSRKDNLKVHMRSHNAMEDMPLEEALPAS